MYILIRLKSNIQSWGDDSRSKTFGHTRKTMTHPTISGLYGLIATCMGIRKNTDKYEELLKLVTFDTTMYSRNYNVMSDYQTVGGGFNLDDEFQKNMVLLKADGTKPVGYGGAKITTREYLINADFIVALKVQDEYADTVEKYLKNPEWVPSIGRACCIPSTRLFVAKTDTFEKALEITKKVFEVDRVYTHSTIQRKGDKVSTVFDHPIKGRNYRNTSRIAYSNIL